MNEPLSEISVASRALLLTATVMVVVTGTLIAFYEIKIRSHVRLWFGEEGHRRADRIPRSRRRAFERAAGTSWVCFASAIPTLTFAEIASPHMVWPMRIAALVLVFAFGWLAVHRWNAAVDEPG